MALMKCIECGNEISDKAFSCPKCGAPIEKKESSKVEETKVLRSEKANKKNYDWKIAAIIIGFLVVCLIHIILKNDPGSIPGIKIKLNTPKPIVVTSRSDSSKSGLLKKRITIYATILNQGGKGNVLVTFHVFQDRNDWDRSKTVYLRPNESENVEETFEQVKRLGGEISYRVDVKAE